MLDVGYDQDVKSSKCYFTQCALPQFIDEKQPPVKRKPFSTVLGQPFNHTIDLVLLKDGASGLQQKILQKHGNLQYAKVHMKLKDLIDGDFFNSYIKVGNILMLSEGCAGVDNTFHLHDGILKLEIDKPTYERAGLAGKPISTPGRKHIKSRFAIELNLRLPSMVRGRPLFNRMVYAFDNALPQSVTWLFYDLENPDLQSAKDSPLMKHAPFLKQVSAGVFEMDSVSVPYLPRQLDERCSDETTELLEWFDLTMMESPRLRKGDSLDPYFSRYTVPDLKHVGLSKAASHAKDTEQMTDEASPNSHVDRPAEVTNLIRIRWHGFIPAHFVSTLLTTGVKESGRDWFALRSQAFDEKRYTLYKSGDTAMVWECD